MTLSAACEIKIGGSGEYHPTGYGDDVDPGQDVTIRLVDSTNVSEWRLWVFGTDETTTDPIDLSEVADTVVSSPDTEVTFTMPYGTGRAIILKSLVQSGDQTDAQTFGFYSLTTSGDRVGAAGETLEGDPDFGWAAKINPLIRRSGGGEASGDATSLRGVNISTWLPSMGQFLGFDGFSYTPMGLTHSATAIQGEQVDPTPPTLNQVLVYDGSSYVPMSLNQDMIQPGFSLVFFGKTNPNGGQLLYRRGDSITGITALAEYFPAPPVGGTLGNTFGGSTHSSDIDPGSWSADDTKEHWTLAGTVRRSGSDLGADPSMTASLVVTKGPLAGVFTTAAWTIYWTRDLFWGVGAAGGLTSSQIQNLSGFALSRTKVSPFTVSPNNQKVYYCYPKQLGLASFVLNGFPASFLAPAEVSVTRNDVTSTYYVYESSNLLTGANLSFTVS